MIATTSRDSFASAIRLNVELLRFSGVVSYEEDEKKKKKTDVRSRQLLATLAYGCLFAYSIQYVGEFALRAAYLDTWMESFAMTLSLVGGQARFTFLLLFRDRFQRLLAICEELWATLSATERRCVREYAKPTRRLTFYYMFGCGFTIIFYAVASLLMAERDDTSNVTTRMLPYTCLVDVQRTPYYEITYAMQLCCMINVGLTCIGTDMIGPVLILIASGHFRVLKLRMLSLSERGCCPKDSRPIAAETTHEKNHEDVVVRNRAILYLGACVRYHQIVLEFCKELEKLTSSMFLTQLLSSTYNISLVGFKLVGDDSDKFKYTTQLSVAVIQLYLCNWPAAVLLTESEAISRAAYFTSWYRFSYRLKQSLNVIAMRSQRPAQLTAGYFVPLSLQTFASMVSSAASFFTMIRSMN